MTGQRDAPPPDTETKPRQFRVATPIWEAFDRVCSRLGMTRAESLNAHIAAVIEKHGDAEDRADLARGQAELAERRARMHPGRPRKGADRPGAHQ